MTNNETGPAARPEDTGNARNTGNTRDTDSTDSTASTASNTLVEDIQDLAAAWEKLHYEYEHFHDGAHDRLVLDCAAKLSADPGGPLAYVWIFGLVLALPHLSWVPGDGVEDAALQALRAAEPVLSAQDCGHDSHPYEIHDDEEDEELAGWLVDLVDETQEWYEDRPRDEWRCPRNAAGFARIALHVLDPGSVSDVPARLPPEAHATIDTLSALLEGYPKTDVYDEIGEQARALRSAEDPDDRAGRIMVVRAVGWYAISGMVRRKAVLDELIEALEEALSHYPVEPCGHAWDAHPLLPQFAPEAARLGIELSYAGGRVRHERRRTEHGDDGAPLELLLCPAFVAGLGQESLTQLRTGRDRLFGPRDVSHLDAEYLDEDGRLQIEKIAERVEYTSRNEQYADDLGLWAARRFEHADHARERAVLLLAADQSLQIAYPAPARAVVEDVLRVLRTVAAAPRPARCAHDDDHPQLRYTGFRHAMAHFYAPEDFPTPERPEQARSEAAWTCPRFLGEVAEAAVRKLQVLLSE
ncbi:hypothetical protein [Streptomyces sp. N2A]|uniref:hypothetical protein n=1 Tax=Streptomyces sp. N2A TaxID=3073936 RepID=UPI00286FDDC7|nr:hypothetical protein [Streptomyces sp. N2A]